MILHNLKQIFRSLWRYKSFSLINFLGLTLGITAIIIIFLVVDFEKGFDNLHSGKNIYRVVSKTNAADGINYSATVPFPLGRLIRAEYSGAIASQIHFINEMNIKLNKQQPFTEKNIVFADSLFFKVFDFSKISHFWLKGNPTLTLNDPGKVILTENTAKKYFGSTDPIGQLIKLDNKAEVQVVAIVKDLSGNTHLPFNMIVSLSSFTKDFLGGLDFNQWGVRSDGYCYIKLPAESSVLQVEKALLAIVQKNARKETDKKEILYLQALPQIHFDLPFEVTNPSYTVSNRYLTMLLLLGGFIMLIACINYINLSTSLAFSKAKEVGIRKTIGASKTQLFFLYMTETFVVTLMATIAGLMLSTLLLPSVNHLLDKSLSLNQLFNWYFIAGCFSLLVLISFISGAYPSIVLSGFNPITSLKNQIILPGRSSTLLRKALVVFQFTTSIALITCTIIIAQQMQFFRTKPIGFNKEAVVEISIPETDSLKRESFRNLLLQEKGVKTFSFCIGAPISDNGFNTSFQSPEVSSDLEHNVKIIPCDSKYIETYGMKLVAGRWFLPGEEKNLGTAFVANETLVKTLGYKNAEEAIGKKITIGVNHMNAAIVGVTADFHVSSLHEKIVPCLMMPFPFFYYAAGVKLSSADMKNTLAGIEKKWKSIFPDQVYSYEFIDEALARHYEQENRDYALFKIFSAVSIFICCIGLWGLIAFVVVRKTKEIGIRKVLGASVQGIVFLISKDFVMLVIIALLVASPIAWYFMHSWLQGFAYRINISWWIFLAAGISALLIALLTVSFQAIKAAIANPVKSLRTE